jgi:hypothetical protein
VVVLKCKEVLSELTRFGVDTYAKLIASQREKKLKKQERMLQATLMAGSIKRIK